MIRGLKKICPIVSVCHDLAHILFLYIFLNKMLFTLGVITNGAHGGTLRQS